MRDFATKGLLLLLAVALLITVPHPARYATQDREHASEGSSRGHVAGTDALGRDRLMRVATASLLCIAGATGAALGATLLATGVGLAAAFSPSFLSGALLLACDTFLSLPWLFLLMMVRAGLPLSTAPMISAAVTFALLALLGWPACARAVYAGGTALRRAEWLVQGHAAGLGGMQLARRHVLPHILPLLLPQFLISIPAFLMAEANLGTLGLGVGEPLPSWGSMLLELDNSALLATSHWVYLPVVLLIVFLVLLELLAAETLA